MVGLAPEAGVIAAVAASALAIAIAVAIAAFITVRRRASSVDRIILRRLHLALDAADAAAWEWRLGLPSLRASGFARLLGADDDGAVTVAAWSRAVHEEDRDGWQRSFDEAIAAGTTWACLHRIVDAHGSVRWLEARAEPITRTDGATDGMVGVCVDVTERQVRQQQARDAARIAHEVADAAAALAGLTDEARIWEEACASAARIFRCDAVRAIGAASLDGLAPVPSGSLLAVPVTLAGETEAHLLLAWASSDGVGDATARAALDRFAAAIALALALARREAANAERDALARRLQAGLMPSPAPTAGTLAVELHYRPGEQRLMLGGDFLDTVRHDDGSVSFVIGDVCGHGPAEAALGTILRSAWTGLAHAGARDPARWLAVLGEVLASRRERPSTFVTVATGTIDPAAATVRYAIAGHPPPLLIDGAAVTALDDGAGPALGLGARRQARTATRAFGDDARLLAVTDGTYEGASGSGTRLGYAGLLGVVGADPPRAGEGALTRLLGTIAVDRGTALDDDAAMLLIARART